MSLLPPEQVHYGFWIDHSQGRVVGSTITISSNNANVVVAVLSVLITFAGSHLWDVIAFCIFATYATMSPRDVIHHQRQVILRNLASPTAVLLKATRICWRHRRLYVLNRLAILIAITAICSSGFLIAGILSSQIISTSDITVLAKPLSSSYQNHDYSSINITQLDPRAAYVDTVGRDSIDYVDTCYNGTESNPACRIFTLPNVPFNTSYAAQCPSQDLCMLKNELALRMDTGLMWSDDAFGVNAAPADRVALRKVTTCAPLNVSRYQNRSDIDAAHLAGEQLLPEDKMVNFYLGPIKGLPFQDTFFVRIFVTNVSTTYKYSTQPWSRDLPGAYEPIEPLKVPESDLVLITIQANSVIHNKPVDDPVFAAHRPKAYLEELSDGTSNATFYVADDVTRVVACSDQYQFCLPNDKCTSLAHAASATNQAGNFSLTSRQNATLLLYAHALVNYGTSMQLITVGDRSALLAKTSRVAADLPPNQWELEVKHWEAIALTSIQKIMSDVGAGLGVIAYEADGNLIPWFSDDDLSFLQHSQKMKAPGNISNINIFGLSLVVAFSGFVILLNFMLIPCLRLLCRVRKADWNYIRLWDEAEILQLQRTVYESNGIATWSGRLHQVPVTTKNEAFRGLVIVANALATRSGHSDPESQAAEQGCDQRWRATWS